jgi:hypothetical protein
MKYGNPTCKVCGETYNVINPCHKQPTNKPPASDSSDRIEIALMAYEIANFREWDYYAAMWRYRNHASTQRAVKAIARLLKQNAGTER